MFTVIEKSTGMAVTVYAVYGQYFLVYYELQDVWGYKDMKYYRPAKPEEV
jgi:hypothetical protein